MFYLTVDEDIKLCLPEARHAEEIFALVDKERAFLREWLPWVDGSISADDTRGFIQATLEQFAHNQGFQPAIFFRGQFVGMTGYHIIDWPNRTVDIGYWLASGFQGQGIVTRSVRYLVTYAFTELKLNRVQIRCAVGNQKSRAIPKRLGFKNEGVLRQAYWLNDCFVDLIIYGMLANEWGEGD